MTTRAFAYSAWAAGSSAVGATILWAAASVWSKGLLHRFQPFSLLLAELAASNILLWTIAGTRKTTLPSWRRRIQLALPGVLQPGMAYALSFLGLQRTTVSNETLIWATESLLMPLFAVIFLGERANKALLGLALASFLGVGLFTFSKPHAGGADPALAGNILVFLAVLCACAYNAFAQQAMAEVAPLPLLALHQAAGLAFGFLLLPFQFLVKDAGSLPLRTIDWAGAAAAGMAFFAIPFWLYMLAMRRFGSSLAAQFLPLIPLFTIFIARWFLGEYLTTTQYIGAALVLAAVAAAARLPSQAHGAAPSI